MGQGKGKSPFDDAIGSISKGFGAVLRAAASTSREIKKEIDKGGVAKAFEESGREIVRAATNVATQVGTGLEAWGKRTQESLDKIAKSGDGTATPDQPDDPSKKQDPTDGPK
jgi:hypothetical protein